MNKIVLIGNLTSDPEYSLVKDDIPLCKFTVAARRPFSTDATDFFPVIVWRRQAENCNAYLSKGKKVAVAGYVQIRNYDTPEGERRYITEVVAQEVEFLSPKDAREDYFESNDKLEEIKNNDGDDLPF